MVKHDATNCLHSLLDEPLLSVEDDEGRRSGVTLPGLFARLSRGESVELTAIQAHQQHAWHAFTVQLAAIALTRARRTVEEVSEEAAWRALLVEAATKDGGGPEAFSLVVSDLSKPAFMQPPVPGGLLAGLKNQHEKPSSELDVLITSKNHDVKMDRIARPTVEHWTFSLVTLQTMQGFLGAGNYGIARMNGGFASRPCVAYAPDLLASSRFIHDVRLLLEARTALIDRGFAQNGLGLVWCAPWDGSTSLQLANLDPFFIEICRRVRLVAANERIVAHRGSSKAARIDASQLTGNTGDPWTPVSRKDSKALTVSDSGFTFDRVQDLMFGDWAPPAAGDPDRAAGRYWVGQVLVRGQGKTGGYHERWVPIPGKARSFLAKLDSRATLGKRAQDWVSFAKIARLNILKPALLNLLQGGPEKLKFDDDRGEPFLAHLNQAIDAVFFPMLFESAGQVAEEANLAFGRKLLELARAELDRATSAVPMSSARRYRAISYAYRSFWGAARNNKEFPRITFSNGPPVPVAEIEGDAT